ncbi:Phosphoenolpyruvate carboxykinase (ATP), partial [Zostera marina]
MNDLSSTNSGCTSETFCGKAFADLDNVKYALSALAAPVVFARGGIPVYGRILSSGDCPILLFAPEKTIQICSELHKNLTCNDAGVVLSSYGSAPFFHRGDSDLKFQMTTPSSVVFASSDCTGVLPLLTKISPDQAAYHFLAGYQDGKFVTTYCKDPSPIPPLELANALLSYDDAWVLGTRRAPTGEVESSSPVLEINCVVHRTTHGCWELAQHPP